MVSSGKIKTNLLLVYQGERVLQAGVFEVIRSAGGNSGAKTAPAVSRSGLHLREKAVVTIEPLMGAVPDMASH